MTKLFEQAIEAARKLPPEEQDDIARAIMQLAGANEGRASSAHARRARSYCSLQSRRCAGRVCQR